MSAVTVIVSPLLHLLPLHRTALTLIIFWWNRKHSRGSRICCVLWVCVYAVSVKGSVLRDMFGGSDTNSSPRTKRPQECDKGNVYQVRGDISPSPWPGALWVCVCVSLCANIMIVPINIRHACGLHNTTPNVNSISAHIQ